jgi:methylenetetrahydrofolate dehydrogenase (NADP+)/methenyltetrahydrofolate cyclohydrolase
MAAELIDGKLLAQEMKAELKEQVSKLKEKGITPALNKDDKIHGILVQLPLPKHINENKIINAINPDKDVDGFHPVSVGKMVLGQETFLPCTPHGVLKLLERYNVETEGAEVLVIGRSNIVGKPVANLLMRKDKPGNSTVTVCHTRTKDILAHSKTADIIIVASGYPDTLTADMVKEDVVVIDVGINRVEDSSRERGYRLIGDADFESLKDKVRKITPVPGGVGPMTITMLLFNTVKSAQNTIK